MNKQKLDFPYEIWDLEQHGKNENAKLQSEETPLTREYVLVGPKGYFLFNGYKNVASDIYNVDLRPTDIFVNSHPRSGTTLTQELVWLVVNNLDFEAAKDVKLRHRYKYLEKSPKEMFPFLKNSDENEEARKLVSMIATPNTEIFHLIPDPRFVKTHLPLSLLPPYILDRAKVVYIARDPRDVVVSFYHYAKLMKERHGFKCEFKQYWKVFLKNLLPFSPYFEHVKEAWAQRHHPNLLFLFDEDLSKDLPASIGRVADFFGKKLTDEQIAALCNHLHIENFRNNKSVNLEDMRPFGVFASDETFIRKGKVGGWRDYFDEEMTLETQRWIDENLRDTDLSFPSME